MKTVKFISILFIIIGILVCSESAFSQGNITVKDSIPQGNITVKDSISQGNITVKDSISQNNIEVKDSTSKEQKRLKFGVGFGLSFVGGTNISLSPNLIYSLSEKIAIGGGIQGSYSAIKNLQSTTTFGANVFTQYSPIKKITTLLEFAELKVSTKTDTPTGKITDDYWDAALFVGAGFNITNKISVGAKYNVLYNEDKSVYTSPIIPFVNISF